MGEETSSDGSARTIELHGSTQMAWSPPGWASERPLNDPAVMEIWCYTGRFTYTAGEKVDIHVHTTATRFALEILRDGAKPMTLLRELNLPGVRSATPEDAYAIGCDWPIAFEFKIPPLTPPGVYLVVARASDDRGQTQESQHFFVVRASGASPSSRIAMLLSTSTMIAYNDWGGANHYRGLGDDSGHDVASPRLSIERPIARGMLRLPGGAPRPGHGGSPGPSWHPRYESLEWARLHGYSRHYADAFWATYERPFVEWAERSGYEFDYLTQHDIHFDPGLLRGYRCLVVVGHDEYWSWEMRDALDGYVSEGGRLARFAGNFAWQVRLEEEGRVQVCYKVPELDPVFGAGDQQRLTTAWDHPFVGRPGAQTMGLTGMAGIYARYGCATPRSPGGFIVYRPAHWAFAGTDLYYGDQLGGPPSYIASFELDGVDYTFEKGLPYPTHSDGAPDSLEILAMAPAVAGEEDRWHGAVPLATGGLAYVEELMKAIRGEDWEYGAGMIAVFGRGRGWVFNAGASEWVRGLIEGDFYVDRVTRNVLDRFIG